MIILDVDWDYWVYEDPKRKWQHKEERAHYVSVWKHRETLAKRRGENLRETITTQGKPTPAEFWQHLIGLGFDLKGAPLVVADSHKYSHEALVHRYPLPHEGAGYRVLHFDAHHDLGYDEHPTLDCGNYLRHVMNHYPKLITHIIYPHWKGLSDLQRRERLWATDRDLTSRLSLSTYKDDFIQPFADTVQMIFIARSGPWSPPWLDEEFQHFVDSAAEHTGTEIEAPYTRQENIDPMLSRY